MSFLFTPTAIYNKVIIVGAGGTGGRLVPLVAQFLKTCSHVIDPEIILIDRDIVETKNLLRQNFIRPDVDKNKADVLAYRYSMAFDIKITAIKEFVDDRDGRNLLINNMPLPSYLNNKNHNSLWIMCVDSAEARRKTLELITSSVGGNKFVIDAGNQDTYGQVKWFNPAAFYVGRSGHSTARNQESLDFYLQNLRNVEVYEPTKVSYIPMESDFYENLADAVGGSCADLDQTLAINAMMATTIMGAVQKLFYFHPFSTTGLQIGLDGAAPMPFDKNYIERTLTVSLNKRRLGSTSNVDAFLEGFRAHNHQAGERIKKMLRDAEAKKKAEEAAEKRAKEINEALARKKKEQEEAARVEAPPLVNSNTGAPAEPVAVPPLQPTTSQVSPQETLAQTIGELLHTRLQEMNGPQSASVEVPTLVPTSVGDENSPILQPHDTHVEIQVGRPEGIAAAVEGVAEEARDVIPEEPGDQEEAEEDLAF